MLKLLFLMSVQSFFLVVSQTALKLTFLKIPFQTKYLISYIKEPLLYIFFGSALIACLLWFYVIKNFELSLAYPLVSLTFIFNLIASYFFLNETITFNKIGGVVLIIIGIFFIIKQ